MLFSAEQAELLQARENDAGLLVERLGFLQDGRAMEFTQSYYRGDIYEQKKRRDQGLTTGAFAS